MMTRLKSAGSRAFDRLIQAREEQARRIIALHAQDPQTRVRLFRD
ncbi:hypothetical protein [Aureimonas mangrovi]|nr:hypothetical protein [Aureimonas mangrovi]